MKKQKNYYKKFWIILISIIWTWIITIYASWGLEKELTNSVSSWVWANSSVQEFSPGGSEWTNFATYYINNEDNSSIIWNYFKWYYYDSIYWFFKLDWNSIDKYQNVRIVNSTDKCSWYWYKLGWYAYSENFWFVDFSYDDDNFVYYCVGDKKLYWYAYLESIWFQNFEWIWFEIIPEIINQAETIESNTFVNDNTEITDWSNKNENKNNNDIIQWNIQYIKDTDWSVFYIIK